MAHSGAGWFGSRSVVLDVRLPDLNPCFGERLLRRSGVLTLIPTRHLWPGYVSFALATLFFGSLIVAPNLAPGPCMESYPVQCRIVEIVGGGLTITSIMLLVSVASLFLASLVTRPRSRAVSIVAGLVGLVIVMTIGVDLSLVNGIELRY